jgi:hypothetical protein
LGFRNMNKSWLSKFNHLSELKKRKENIDINVYPIVHSKRYTWNIWKIWNMNGLKHRMIIVFNNNKRHELLRTCLDIIALRAMGMFWSFHTWFNHAIIIWIINPKSRNGIKIKTWLQCVLLECKTFIETRTCRLWNILKL